MRWRMCKLPAILKTRRFGYDGKGQALVRSEKEAFAALKELGGQPAVIERLVTFEREISVIVVRGQDGEMKFYDPVENVHQNGILAISRVPARIHDDCAEEARGIAGKIAEALGHVGVLCVEMFQRGADSPRDEVPRLLVNEIAPRVHNSGHWTIDACLVSQFENHVRAIAGWPLGDTERHSDAVMTNLIGDDVNRWRELAARGPRRSSLRQGRGQARPQDGPHHAAFAEEFVTPTLWTISGAFVTALPDSGLLAPVGHGICHSQIPQH